VDLIRKAIPDSRRTVVWSALLGLVVVLAAGITGTAHFSGPRWLPKIRLSGRAPTPHTQRPPKAQPLTTSARHPQGGGSSLGSVLIWVIVAIVVIAIALQLWRWWARRPSRAATDKHAPRIEAVRELQTEPEPEPAPDTPILRSGIELALEMLDEQREPGDAIVRAWLGLEQTAESAGILRAAAETPTEFTSRILGRAFADDQAIRTLLRLYLRTRFGDHPATSDDVAAVRAALEALVQSWQSADPSATAGARQG
jgi:flagellar basal body-associated protein FliL